MSPTCFASHRVAAEVPHLERLLVRLEEVLHHLEVETLTPEQAHHVMYQAMPKLVLMLLKLRCSDAEMCDRLNEFFQVVLRTTVQMLRHTNYWELVECAARVLTDCAAHQLYSRPMSSGQSAAAGKSHHSHTTHTHIAYAVFLCAHLCKFPHACMWNT